MGILAGVAVLSLGAWGVADALTNDHDTSIYRAEVGDNLKTAVMMAASAVIVYQVAKAIKG